MSDVTFRYAKREDAELILKFIKDLARYEKMENEVVATKELLEEWLFEKEKAEVIFAVSDGKEIGFALFFHNFSTFLGRAGIYLEDLYVMPEYRGRGYGKAILKKLAEIAKEIKPDFIKTSTGFGPSGAKVEDVKLMKSIVRDDIKVKAAGGIRNSDDFLAMVRAGADRIGCSAGVKIIEALKERMKDDNVTTIEINR